MCHSIQASHDSKSTSYYRTWERGMKWRWSQKHMWDLRYINNERNPVAVLIWFHICQMLQTLLRYDSCTRHLLDAHKVYTYLNLNSFWGYFPLFRLTHRCSRPIRHYNSVCGKPRISILLLERAPEIITSNLDIWFNDRASPIKSTLKSWVLILEFWVYDFPSIPNDA